jgi:hypothetical protein
MSIDRGVGDLGVRSGSAAHLFEDEDEDEDEHDHSTSANFY